MCPWLGEGFLISRRGKTDRRVNLKGLSPLAQISSVCIARLGWSSTPRASFSWTPRLLTNHS